MVTIWICFRISGAFFNPAISLANWLAGTCNLTRTCVLFVSQVVGGIAGTAVTLGLSPDHCSASPALSPNTSLPQGVFIEVCASSLFKSEIVRPTQLFSATDVHNFTISVCCPLRLQTTHKSNFSQSYLDRLGDFWYVSSSHVLLGQFIKLNLCCLIQPTSLLLDHSLVLPRIQSAPSLQLSLLVHLRIIIGVSQRSGLAVVHQSDVICSLLGWTIAGRSLRLSYVRIFRTGLVDYDSSTFMSGIDP